MAHTLLYLSTLGLRVINKKGRRDGVEAALTAFRKGGFDDKVRPPKYEEHS